MTTYMITKQYKNVLERTRRGLRSSTLKLWCLTLALYI